MTLAEPMEKSSSRVSMVISSPRNCSMWIGKTGGWTAACRASFRLPLGWAGPCTVRRAPGSCSGREEGQAQNVVEVQVGQQRRGVQRRPEGPHLLVQHITQRAQPGAQVDDERLVALDVDDQAGRVPPYRR